VSWLISGFPFPSAWRRTRHKFELSFTLVYASRVPSAEMVIVSSPTCRPLASTDGSACPPLADTFTISLVLSVLRK
jgi:hypothetical protein